MKTCIRSTSREGGVRVNQVINDQIIDQIINQIIDETDSGSVLRQSETDDAVKTFRRGSESDAVAVSPQGPSPWLPVSFYGPVSMETALQSDPERTTAPPGVCRV